MIPIPPKRIPSRSSRRTAKRTSGRKAPDRNVPEWTRPEWAKPERNRLEWKTLERKKWMSMDSIETIGKTAGATFRERVGPPVEGSRRSWAPGSAA